MPKISAVNPSEVSCLVKSEISLAATCLTSSVVMVILGGLQLYPLLLPGYITAGASGALFLLGTLSHLYRPEKEVKRSGFASLSSQVGVQKKHSTNGESVSDEVSDSQTSLCIKDFVLISSRQLQRHCVLLHPQVVEQLGEQILVGNAIYYTQSSPSIRMDSIGMSTAQYDQLKKDLGWTDSSEQNISILLESVSKITEPSKKISLEVKSLHNNEENGKYAYYYKDELEKLLFDYMEGGIFGSKQSFVLEIHEKRLKVSIEGEKHEMVGPRTKIEIYPDNILLIPDDAPFVEDVELVFRVTIDSPKTIFIEEEGMKDTLAGVRFYKEIVSCLSRSECTFFWKVGDYVSIPHPHQKNKIRFYLRDIKTLDGSSHRFARIPFLLTKRRPQKVSLDPLTVGVAWQKTSFKELKSKPQPEMTTTSDNRPVVESSVEEDEMGLTIVERLEKRGIGGLPVILNDIFQPIVNTRLNPNHRAIYEKWNFKFSKGVLLSGPPGTGKTSIARHIGQILVCDQKMIKYAKGSDLLHKYVGESGKAVKELFVRPENCSFFVIILDEVESLLSKRENHDQAHEDQFVTEFLQQIDGIETRDDFIIIGLTNFPEKIDPAFLRPGRLGKPVVIPLPDQKARKSIFEIYLKNLYEKNLVDSEVVVDQLVLQTEGFSGAQIEEIVRLATQRCINEEIATSNSSILVMDDLNQAIESIKSKEIESTDRELTRFIKRELIKSIKRKRKARAESV